MNTLQSIIMLIIILLIGTAIGYTTGMNKGEVKGYNEGLCYSEGFYSAQSDKPTRIPFKTTDCYVKGWNDYLNLT